MGLGLGLPNLLFFKHHTIVHSCILAKHVFELEVWLNVLPNWVSTLPYFVAHIFKCLALRTASCVIKHSFKAFVMTA